MTEIAPTMRSNRDAHSGFVDGDGLITHSLRASHDASEDGTGRGTPLVADGGGGVNSENQIGVRRLMPIECERLQGFPDDWTRYGIAEVKFAGEIVTREIEMSDSARYFVCGNAVTSNVAHWIGLGIPLNLK